MPAVKPILGIVGGIGSGKTHVAAEFARLGAAVIDADHLGHEVLELPEIRAAARARWGERVLGPAGRIDREAVAAIVFAPTPQAAEELAYLERLTHGEIRRLAELRVDELLSRGDVPAIVVDAPLLVEAGWNGFCDKIVYVEAPEAVRSSRVRSRGWSEEELQRRQRRQAPLAEKRKLADVVIDNSGDATATRAQVERAWQAWVANPRAAD